MFDHISDVLLSLGWLNAREFVEYAFWLCILHSMISSGQLDILASQINLNREVRERNTRQSGDINLARPRNNHGKRTFIYRASALFNRLSTVTIRHLYFNLPKSILSDGPARQCDFKANHHFLCIVKCFVCMLICVYVCMYVCMGWKTLVVCVYRVLRVCM